MKSSPWFTIACSGMLLASMFCGAIVSAVDASDDTEASTGETSEGFENVTLRGQVVWLGEALQRRFGIETDEDAAHSMVALETNDGKLVPLAKDFRGRGFYLDPRIRDIDLELLVRRHAGSPVVQVIRVYTLKSEGRYELDYWCDICSIPMYELKPCECCQAETRLRERKVNADGTTEETDE